jgi:heme-degrading monooxygenase HmoA
MFTRVVELRTKTGKTKELSTTMNEKVVPILRKQPGFIDEITLISTLDPERILALSFWQDEADATRYNTEQYPMITDMLGSLLETTPTVQTFNVDLSTTHKISKGKAA